MASFIANIEEIRERARKKIDEGPVTEGYRVDKDRAIGVLNEALATEIVCVLRYMHHYFMATGVHGRAVADEFKEHADDEREHADRIAERIQQLGGKPDLNPGTLVQRSVAQYVEGETLADMIREDLVAERVVIDVYREMIRFFGEDDSTTRIMLEEIMSDEEEHATDLADFLYIVDPRSGETTGQDPGTKPLGEHRQQMHGQQQQRTASSAQRANDAGAGGRRVAARNEGMEAVEPMERMSGDEQPEMTAARVEGDRGRNRGQRWQEPQPEARRAEQKREGIRGELRPARGSGQERPDLRGQGVPPAHEPGTTGRPTRKRTPEIDAVAAAQEERSQAGASRSVRLTNPSRKGRKIA